MTTIDLTQMELREVADANASGRTPVVFVHGLWLLDSSWDRWATYFHTAGYAPVTPGWPDDPETIEAARQDPSVFAGKGIGDVAAYQAAVIDRLDRKPAVVGHSFGGLLAQILAGRGLSSATVAIDPAPTRGVLPLPATALKAAAPVLLNPANRHRAVALTFEQFRFGFANAVSEEEAHQLYQQYHVPGSGIPVFEAALANLDPRSEAKADATNPDRGPMLIVSGEQDHQVPWAIAKATYKRQAKNPGVTEIVEIPGRGHSLTIDHGWESVAEVAVEFISRFVG
ncbi:alpha/beta hydrolase [Mycobacterium sp. MS1601]|uniref:alpha/beta hydrolase n=1 Tax=Mycobacterium sp. MS1601 TaxID=1936029 RepID=UPI00097936E5|nr:alpha/beta hydrolase [Mycobacterium sp. MS1601]AQA04243.1 alpha/beta hydrolase [Mycobacterium sp. MS1601]